jgi:hypothetical protein
MSMFVRARICCSVARAVKSPTHPGSRHQSHRSPRGIHNGQSGTGRGCCASTSAFLNPLALKHCLVVCDLTIVSVTHTIQACKRDNKLCAIHLNEQISPSQRTSQKSVYAEVWPTFREFRGLRIVEEIPDPVCLSEGIGIPLVWIIAHITSSECKPSLLTITQANSFSQDAL